MDQINADVAWFNADHARRIARKSGPSWTEERVALLEKLWMGGLSCSEIAVELPGFSRNAVISKVRRIGLPGRKEPRAEVRPRNPPRKRYRRTGFDTYTKQLELLAVPILPIDDLQIPLEQRKMLIELTEHTCRWPVGDPGTPEFFFCGGNKLQELPYCAAHCRQAFRPSRRADHAAKYPGVA